MPQFLRPNKSTQHRVAAIALYRALLSRCSSAPLPGDDRDSLRNAIRNKFRRNKNLQSPYLLGLSFKAGYETLDHLDASTSGDTVSSEIVKRLIAGLSRTLIRAPSPRVLASKPSSPERLACLPPERAVLNVRPYARTSGPRHVPVLANANGIPFLRLTKPQPAALSRVIRQRLVSRMNLFDTKVMLGNWWLPMARQEDEWDSLVNRRAGRNMDGREDDVKWVHAITASERLNQEVHERTQARDRATTRRMQRIVDLETRMALKEGQTVVRGRKNRPLRVIQPPKPKVEE
ncbi:hypothetical protein BDU57DRAFT_460445 [Ampelomyces quisqualis]|uniref:Complex 1 LYR protein domain-containing protein n=1 Tax=Ampelomyces quisqualis TaxID=50730 RepID=A0A6A5Q951_AMPQU|nr:hypothetical protein BDU57DRAFT_460445 [Ampelomyces quisqualis]